MSKKTFIPILRLMLGAGVLALAFFVVGSRPGGKADAPIWKMKTNRWRVSGLSFSPDGKTILNRGDKGLQKWEPQTGKPLPVAALFQDNAAGHFKAISSNHEIAVTGRKGKLRIVNTSVWSKWKVENFSNGKISIKPKEKPVKATIRNYLISQRALDVWNFKASNQLFSVPIPDDVLGGTQWSVSQTLLSPDGSRFFLTVEKADNAANIHHQKNQLWDTRRALLLWQNRSTRSSQRPDVRFPFFDARNRLCYAAAPILKSKISPPSPHYSSGLDIMDFQTERLMGQFEAALGLPTNSGFLFWQGVTFSPDGRLVAAVFKTSDGYTADGWDGTIVCWDSSNRRVKWTFQQNRILPKILRFAPDSKSLAVGAESFERTGSHFLKGALFLLDSNEGRQIQRWSEENWRDRVHQNWDQTTGNFQQRFSRYFRAKPAGFLRGDSGEISTLAFSPNGKTLAAGYADGSIKLWRVPQ